MNAPSAYDHLRPTDDDPPDGTYRVVGTGDAGVTLLRVADADGRRVNSGELRAVGHDELDGFAPAENPDGNRPLGVAVASTLVMVYWSIRVFVQQLLVHPLAAAVALALLAAGNVGNSLLPMPDAASGVLLLVGRLGLAYVGSGRLGA